VRVAGDSLPPMRRTVLRALLNQQTPSTTADVAKATDRAWTSVDRQLNALLVLGLVKRATGEENQSWQWSLSDGVDTEALKQLVTGNVEISDDTAPSGPSGTPTASRSASTLTTSSINAPCDDVPGEGKRASSRAAS
jgi:hypothetical protein